jgi:hypothetical protein
MRLVVGSEVPLEDWCDFAQDTRAIRAYWNLIQRYCIVNYSESQIATSSLSIRRLANKPNVSDRGVLSEVATMLERIPANLVGSDKYGPMSITNPDSHSGLFLDQLVNSRNFWKQVEEAHRTPKRKEQRDQVFNRLIRASLYTANAVTVFDKYAGSNLHQHQERSGTYWLLDKLMASPVSVVTFYTYQVDGGRGRSPEVTDILEAFKSAHDSIIKSNRVVPAKIVKVGVMSKLGSFQHDRHMKFVFNGRNGLALTLGAGTDVFRYDELQDNHTIAEISFDNASERERSFTASNARAINRMDFICP